MKSDLSKIMPERKCCMLAEFTAMLKATGSIVVERNGKKTFRFNTENVNVAKKFYLLVKEIFNIHPGIIIRKSKKLKEHNVYIVAIDNSMENSNIFFDILLDEKENKGHKGFAKNICCKKAYLRGIFLTTGSITNPNNCYHVEIIAKDREFSEIIVELLNKLEIIAKITTRKNNYVVYIKESEQISSLLNTIGAHKALMELENIRILKEMRNNVNRIVNCETANISKIVDASVRHINSIKYLIKIGMLEKLPAQLKEIAKLRVQYSDSSLKELGMMLKSPIGKSGVNHRLNKLDEIAEKLKPIENWKDRK
jgi:hypothetical protein